MVKLTKYYALCIDCAFAMFNVVVKVLRGPARMHFTKYVSASAPGSRWDIRAEYQVAPESDPWSYTFAIQRSVLHDRNAESPGNM